MAIDKKKFRESWLKGLKDHVSSPAIGARLAAKHKPSEGTPAPPDDGGDDPMEAHAKPMTEPGEPAAEHMPPMASDGDGDEGASGHESCPHCGSPMKKKPMHKPEAKGGMDHGLDAASLDMLMRAHG